MSSSEQLMLVAAIVLILYGMWYTSR